MRHTRNDLAVREKEINRLLGTVDAYYVQFAYGRPRLHMRAGMGEMDISPRLPLGEMFRWLDAFIAGIAAGAQAARGAEKK